MSRKKHSECRYNWYAIATKLKVLQEQISQLDLDMTLRLMPTEGLLELSEQHAISQVVVKLRAAEEAISGLSYMCYPQSEWLGGEQFVVRVPHIIADYQRSPKPVPSLPDRWRMEEQRCDGIPDDLKHYRVKLRWSQAGRDSVEFMGLMVWYCEKEHFPRRQLDVWLVETGIKDDGSPTGIDANWLWEQDRPCQIELVQPEKYQAVRDAYTAVLLRYAAMAKNEGWQLVTFGDRVEAEMIVRPEDRPDGEGGTVPPIVDLPSVWQIIMHGRGPHHQYARWLIRVTNATEWSRMVENS